MNGNVFGERLKNARIMSGLSMDDLVERMNHSISKMAISKYESGAMLPDSSVLISISNALGQNPDYFFRPFTVSLGTINFRKKSSLSVKAENTIKHKVKDFVERYIEIEEICDVSNVSELEKFPIKDAGDVINAANKLINQWGVGKDGIFSVNYDLEIYIQEIDKVIDEIISKKIKKELKLYTPE